MDPSSCHHPRYVPFSHPLPPPPHPPPSYHQQSPRNLYPSPSYHQEIPRNLYPSRHHLPPPPPLPPPPQQNQNQQKQPYQPFPPPPPLLPRQQQYSNHPPYIPHHPQFASDPIFDSNPIHQFHEIPQRRLPEYDTRSHYWPDGRVSMPHSHTLSDLDPEAHFHQFDRRPASPGIDRFMHDIEGTPRFRDLESNQRDREDIGRPNNDRWISDSRSSRDFGIVSFGFESNSNNSRFDHEVTENMRRVLCLREQLIDGGNNEMNERDEMRVFTRKNDYYDPEAERYSDKGSGREDNHELNRTPWKQIQKKSVFLRIQKAEPSHRSREDERSHYLSYHNERKTGALRGKALVLHSEHGMHEKKREGSPVELDVSFKSNSLVAKAIVSPAPNSDTNLRPRNTRKRKVMIFDKGSPSFQPNMGNESSAKFGDSSSAVKSGSGSVYSKQSEGEIKSSDTGKSQDDIRKLCPKVTNVPLRKGRVKQSPKVTITEGAPVSEKKPGPSERKGTLPSIGNMGDDGMQSCYNRVNSAVGENKVEGTFKRTVSDKSGASAGKSSTLKPNKKKIIVRKVVRKVVSPSNLGNSELANKGYQLVKADITTRCASATSVTEESVTPFKMKVASTFGDSVNDVDSECSPEESALILANEKVNTSKDNVLKDVCTDVDPGSSVSLMIKRKRNSSTLVLNSSSLEDTNVDQGSTNAGNSVLGLHIISNIKEDHTEKPNETINSGTLGAQDINEHHTESYMNYGLSRSEDIKAHEGSGFDCVSSSTQDKNINCDIGVANSGGRQVHTMLSSPVVEDGSNGELPEANRSVGSDKMPHLPCVGKTHISSGSIYGDCSNHDRCTTHTPDIGYVNLRERNHEICHDYVLSLGLSGTGIPSAVESVECRDKYAAGILKRKVGISELDLSSSALTNISAGSADVLTSANCVDGTICTSDIDINPDEPMVSIIGWPDVDLQHSEDKVLQSSNSNNTFPESGDNADGKGPEKKKRKISTSNSSLTSPLISQSFTVSDIFESAVQAPSNFTDLMQLEFEVKVSSTYDLNAEGIDLLHVNSSVVGPSVAVCSFSDACSGDLSRIDPCSALAVSVAPSSPCLHRLKLGGEQFSTGTPVSAISNHQIDAMDIEDDDKGKVLVDTEEEQNITSSEITQCRIIPAHKSSSLDKMLPSIGVDDDNHLPLRDDLPSTSNSLISGVGANKVSATNSCDEAMLAPDILCDVGSLSSLLLSTSTCKAHLFQNSEEKTCGSEQLSDDKPVIEGVCNSLAHVSDSQHSKTILKSSGVILTNQPSGGKAGLLASHDSESTISLNFLSGETQGRKTQHSHVGTKSYPVGSSFISSTSKNTTSTNITKPRTWYRTDNSFAYPLSGNKPSLSANPMKRQTPTYFRKGNSLVRKSISVPAHPQGSHSLSSSVYRLKPVIVDEVKKGTGPNNRGDAVELRTASANTSFERPITPPLFSVTKVPKHTLNSSGECVSSPLAEPSTSEGYETTANHPSSMKINDVLKSPEDGLKTSETLKRTGSVNSMEGLNAQSESGLIPSNEKRVTYAKPESNQLVATSDYCHTSILDVGKNQSHSASSDGYYKKRKNQLIRTALESHMKQAVTMSDDIYNSVRQIAAKVISSRPFSKRRSNKVVTKTHKPSKFSLVWTPHSARLSNNDGNPLCYPKVRPQLFPWKRMAHKRSFRLSSVSSYNSSLSMIGRKMLLLRKRNTVYTRSTNGFSICKSKVLSVGCSSLKWSKSIENYSRKANELLRLEERKESKVALFPGQIKKVSLAIRFFRVKKVGEVNESSALAQCATKWILLGVPFRGYQMMCCRALLVSNQKTVPKNLMSHGDWSSGIMSMFELAMATSLLEIQRSALMFWQVRKFVGVCTLPGYDWLKSGSTVNFSQDLENATKMMESVPIFMIPPKF